MTDRPFEQNKPKAVVYGAGVAGLTAAHELVVRGFGVLVVEEAVEPRGARLTPAVGGVAKSQWSAFPLEPRGRAGPLRQVHAFPPEPRDHGGVSGRDDLPRVIEFQPGKAVPTTEGARDLEQLRRFLTLPSSAWLSRIELYGFVTAREATALGEQRIEHVQEALETGPSAWKGMIAKSRTLVGYESPTPKVRVRPQLSRFPGEHGYRFFPAFYAHLLDTMRRTPVIHLQERTDDWDTIARYGYPHYGGTPEAYEPTGETAYDALISLPEHALALRGQGEPLVLSRRRAESLTELAGLFGAFVEGMGFEERDIVRWQTKLLQYATSCEARRRGYERISFAEFLDLDCFSEAFARAIERWPKALVGLRSSESDARTHGNVVLQLMLDQLRTGFTDGTLNGPTSEVWFDTWKRFLEEEWAVEFVCGELAELALDEDGLKGRARRHSDDSFARVGQDYVVVALPPHRLHGVLPQKLFDELRSGGYDPEDIAELSTVRDWSEGLDPTRPDGPLRTYSGIQFYFPTDIYWVDGHTYYADSPWALSSISQARYFIHWPEQNDQFGGVLSVVIGDFDVPGTHTTSKCARDCSPQEIADEAWAQIEAALSSPAKRTLPTPSYFHLDRELEIQNGCVTGTKAPYLVNQLGTWEARPGDVGEYRLLFDRLVFAGAHCKTSTRLATMESANESARLAVNAIAKHARGRGHAVGALCDVWPLESREPDDLDVWKELDRRLHAAGRPHMLDIVSLEHWLRMGVRPGGAGGEE